MHAYTTTFEYAALNLAANIAVVMLIAVALVRLGLYCVRDIRAAWKKDDAREDSPS